MVEVREVFVEGVRYPVVLSDEKEALFAAKAAGSAFVAVGEGLAAEYAVETREAADERFLERVVRRKLSLPWQIAESERIRIRELTAEDQKAFAQWDPTMNFAEPDFMEAYIREQYRVCEYGVWGVVRREDGKLLGVAGVFAGECESEEEYLELGYEIFRPYRRRGYAAEACRLILDYVEKEYQCPVRALVDERNAPSRALLEKIGFVRESEFPEEGRLRYRYAGC